MKEFCEFVNISFVHSIHLTFLVLSLLISSSLAVRPLVLLAQKQKNPLSHKKLGRSKKGNLTIAIQNWGPKKGGQQNEATKS